MKRTELVRVVSRLVAAVAVAVVPMGVLGADRAAAQLPACTGNGVVQVAPYSCTATRTIDGTTFTIVLEVGADRSVTAAYSLDAPRDVPTPIRLESHVGVGGTPPAEGRSSSDIPPGETSATLAVILQCGQIDVKAVTLGNGQPSGRIAGPVVTTADNCAPPTTTVPTTTVPITVATTPPTTPASTEAPASAAVLPASALPPTGSGGPGLALWVVLGAVCLGSTAIVVAARNRGV